MSVKHMKHHHNAHMKKKNLKKKKTKGLYKTCTKIITVYKEKAGG